MTLPIILSDEAERDYEDAYDWLEVHRPGTEVAFEARIREALAAIARSPRASRVVLQDVRKKVVAKIPYVIHYRVLSDHILIVSVFHTSRDPADWQGRVP